MEYLVILILLAIAVIYFLRREKTPNQKDDPDHVDATFICDECGEKECICREEKKPK